MPSIPIGGISLIYVSIFEYTYKIYLYLSSISLFVLTFQVHCMWTEYLYRFYFWNHQVARHERDWNPVKNAVHERTRCHKRTLSRLLRTLSQTRRYMHLRPLNWQVSPGRVALKYLKREAVYIKFYGTVFFW